VLVPVKKQNTVTLDLSSLAVDPQFVTIHTVRGMAIIHHTIIHYMQGDGDVIYFSSFH